MNSRYSKSIRIEEWWQPKAGNILAVVYLLIAITILPFREILIFFLPSVITIIGFAGFGHFVNDWCDIETDRKAGKNNRLAKLTIPWRITILVLLIILTLAPWWLLPWDTFSISLILLEFFLLIIYSVPPIRLKGSALGGIFADAIYAYAIPSLLAAYTYFLIAGKSPDFVFLALLTGWQTFTGLHNILIHQLEDFQNDQKSGIRTLPVKLGLARGTVMKMRLGLIPEVFFFLAMSIWLTYTFNIIYIFLPLMVLIYRYQFLFSGNGISTLRQINGQFGHQSVNLHYHRFLPYWHLLFCLLSTPHYLLLLAFHTIFFFRSLPDFVLRLASIAANYGVYYSRRFFLGQDPPTARKEPYDDKEILNLERKKLKSLPAIAVINRNKGKFTETFIRQHWKHLPFRIFSFYGQDRYYPRFMLNRGHVNSLIGLSEDLFGAPSDFLIRWAFRKTLRQKNIRLILAEFGTTGATVAPLCRELGIPLIVIFYGYDSSNRNILKDFEKEYQAMFDYSSNLIGVSKEICRKLAELGAPSEKITYLPCAVDLDLFQYVDHSQNNPVFLAVGRFAEMKSPHLTILAFQKVQVDIPEAELIMVGNAGPGDLSEACKILVRSLDLEEKVTFKGVLSPVEVFNEMKNAAVFVQHSLTPPVSGDKEGTPVAIMEAMACGLPVVATHHAGIDDIIEHGKTGLLIEEYDVEGMARGMKKMITDKAFSNQIGENARKAILEHPLITRHNKILEGIINKSINAIDP